MEMFNAKLFTIRKTIYQLREFLATYHKRGNYPIRKVFIFSDSQSGLKRIHNLTTRPGQSLIQKLTNDLLWITNKFQITVQFEWVSGYLGIRNNEIMDQLAKKTAINEDNRLPDNGYTLLTHVKVSVRRSCLKDWTKHTMKMY
jgi:RNase H